MAQGAEWWEQRLHPKTHGGTRDKKCDGEEANTSRGPGHLKSLKVLITCHPGYAQELIQMKKEVTTSTSIAQCLGGQYDPDHRSEAPIGKADTSQCPGCYRTFRTRGFRQRWA